LACRFSPEALPYAVTPVDNLFLAEFMPRSTGLQAQVYLYGLFLCYNPSSNGGDSGAEIAKALGVNLRDVVDAFAYWQGQGLVRLLADSPLEVEYLSLRPAGYGAPPLKQIPGQYYALVERLQKILAPRTFGSSEMRYVRDWIEVYGFEEHTVEALVRYCLHCTKNRAGIKYMDTVARSWADANVRTLEEAEAHIADYEERVGGAQAILKRWRVNRRPSEDELNLYQKWTREWGFTREAILAACPAMTSATNPSFDYLNGILKRIYEDGQAEADTVAGNLSLDRKKAELAGAVFRAAGIVGSKNHPQRDELWELSQSLPTELLLLAAERARGKKDPYAYLRRIALRWREQGITTPEQARADMEQMKARPAAKDRPGFDYEQRAYSEGDLAGVIVDLEEEL